MFRRNPIQTYRLEVDEFFELRNAIGQADRCTLYIVQGTLHIVENRSLTPNGNFWPFWPHHAAS